MKIKQKFIDDATKWLVENNFPLTGETELSLARHLQLTYAEAMLRVSLFAENITQELLDTQELFDD